MVVEISCDSGGTEQFSRGADRNIAKEFSGSSRNRAAEIAARFNYSAEGRELGEILLRSRPRFLWKFITTFTRDEIKTGLE